MRSKGTSIMEVLFIIAMFGLFLIPSAIFKQWWLFTAFLVFGVIFGLVEWLAKVKSGKTVSQHFWELSKNNKKAKWIILASMIISWLLLIIHLACK